MNIRQFEIWIADLNPQMGTETGKTRPVVVVQTDMLNKVNHPTTIICPITINVKRESEIMRTYLTKGVANVSEDCDIMIDQIRAIDNRRFVRKIGTLPSNKATAMMDNLKIVLELF